MGHQEYDNLGLGAFFLIPIIDQFVTSASFFFLYIVHLFLSALGFSSSLLHDAADIGLW